MAFNPRCLFALVVVAATCGLVSADFPTFPDFTADDFLKLVGKAIWGDTCDNYVQATVGAMGMTMASLGDDDEEYPRIQEAGGGIQLPGERPTVHIGNHFDCLRLKTYDECKEATSRHGIPCFWCPHAEGDGWNPDWAKYFGEGSCYVDVGITRMGCGVLPVADLGPMVTDLESRGITPPSLDAQAECFNLTFDLDACNSNPKCATCDIPDVYGLRWSNTPPGKYQSVCAMKELLYAEGETAPHGAGGKDPKNPGWCAKINNVPDYATNFLLPSVQHTKRVRSKSGRLTFSSGDDTLTTSVGIDDSTPEIDDSTPETDDLTLLIDDSTPNTDDDTYPEEASARTVEFDSASVARAFLAARAKRP